MFPSHHLSAAAVVGIVMLLIWRIYRRTRRSVGRQRLQPFRPWLAVMFLSLLALLLLLASLTRPLVAASEIAGLIVGVLLAIYGLRHTSFERTATGLYYTPNAHIGIALSTVFAGFIAYRVYQRYLSSPPAGDFGASFHLSPLTVLLIGTLAGYYAWYSAGVLRWRRAVLNDNQSSAPVKGSDRL